MIKLFQPYVNDQARANVQRVLSGHQLAQGPEVDLFEQEFAAAFGFEPWQIVSLNSGTSALELAYELVGIRGGYGHQDEVITPVLTCTATNIPLVRAGAKIVFADVEGKKSLNASADDVWYKINDDTKAIVFVHFGGSSEGLQEFEHMADEHDVDLICDAAQALGSELSKRARFSCVSLQAIKSLTAGDGGVLICRDREDAIKARKLRWFGYDRELKQKMGDIDLDLAGYKMHMNDISAAIARGNLAEWEKIVEHRRHINYVYFTYWKAQREAGRHEGSTFIAGVWNPQVIDLLHNFTEMKEKCAAAGFEIGQYHYPNSKYSVFRSAMNDCPKMDRLKDNYFMLPCHLGMTIEDAELIAKTIWPE